MLQRWSALVGAAVKAVEYTSAVNFLVHAADAERTDILLLDIEMGPMDGVTLVKKLRRN